MRPSLLTIAVALLAAPAAARAEEYTAQAGAVSATLTWTAPAQDDAALRRLHRERLRGHLHPVGVYGAVAHSGRRYVRKLDKRLRKLGYLRRLRR